jgi:hypothetical protein
MQEGKRSNKPRNKVSTIVEKLVMNIERFIILPLKQIHIFKKEKEKKTEEKKRICHEH